MTTRLPILCDSCAFLRPQARYGSPLTCDAFSDGILVSILSGGDHRQAVEGDNGVQYTLQPGSEDLLDLWADRRDALNDERQLEG